MRLLVYHMLVNANGIYYVHVCEQAWNSVTENVCIIIIIRYIHTNTAQTSTVITNNGSKYSKCKPESDTQ